MGKGSARRPTLVPREVADLRWALALGHINREQYDKSMAELENDSARRPKTK